MKRRCATTLIRCCALIACGSLCALNVGCQAFSRRGAVSQEVQNCRQLSSQGMAAIERGEWTNAEQLLHASVQSCPIDVEARRRYAEALWHRGDAAGAMGQLEEAAQLSPDNPAIHLRMGEIYLALNHPRNALQAADRALRLDPRNPTYWALHARAASADGNTRQALSDYQRALGYQPSDPAVLESLADLYLRMGQPERALPALQTLIDACPPGEEPAKALQMQGAALMALRRPSDAADSFQMAADRGATTPDLLCHLGEAQWLAGRLAEAQSTAEKSLSLAPDHAGTRALAMRLQAAMAEAPGALRR